VALVIPTLADPVVHFAIGWEHRMYPERACDWIEQHGVRGRAFNTFSFGGYLLYRFYPDPGRLPFMDIHQAGTKEIRYLYAYALQDTAAWRVTDQRFHFDWVLLPGVTPGSPLLANFLDADRTWALVFADDEAVLWLRRGGACDSLARAYAYHYLPGGPAGIGPLGERAGRDSTVRGPIGDEIDRAIAGSPYNARAQAFAGNLALLEGRFTDAERHFDVAARQHPLDTVTLDRQGLAHLYAGDLAGAERAFRAADRAPGPYAEADLRQGQLLAARGRRDEARRAYERSLAHHPDLTEARDSLEAMEKSRR
jgi:tetratricopeptide (TPR) repeat protein